MNIHDYKQYHENKKHGRELFPFDAYICTIPMDFASVPMHWHDEMEIVYFKKGRGTISVDLEEMQVEGGSIVLILPGKLHAIHAEEGVRLEYENIIFSTEILESKSMDICTSGFLISLFTGRVRVPVCFKKGCACYEEIAGILDEYDEIGREKPSGAEFLIKAMLFRLLFILKKLSSENTEDEGKRKNIERLKTVVKYVEEHYAEPVTVEQAAREAACAPAYFMRLFKKTFGVSFITYLNEYRLTMSARLLSKTSATVLDIASQVGFDNLSYFSRSFKKRYGMSPGEYRKHTE